MVFEGNDRNRRTGRASGKRRGGAGAKQAGEAGTAGQLCKIRGVVEFVLVGSARIWGPLFLELSGLGGTVCAVQVPSIN